MKRTIHMLDVAYALSPNCLAFGRLVLRKELVMFIEQINSCEKIIVFDAIVTSKNDSVARKNKPLNNPDPVEPCSTQELVKSDGVECPDYFLDPTITFFISESKIEMAPESCY